MRLALAAVVALTAVGSARGWHTFHAHGIRVRYPPGWSATARPLTPVTSPGQVLAVASYPLPRGPGGADGCDPKQALDRLPEDGAFLFGWEYGAVPARDRADFPPRPRRFRLRHLSTYECLGRSYLLRFRDAGRFFQIHVVFGARAGARIRAEALRVLDSFAAARR